jgi:thiamine pyrophosphate-dependent acetolactate synthase large subunit-like protein
VPGLDFVALAAGYGIAGERVTQAAALSEALRRGMSADGPRLIEVEVESTVPPLI